MQGPRPVSEITSVLHTEARPSAQAQLQFTWVSLVITRGVCEATLPSVLSMCNDKNSTWEPSQ